MFLPMKSVITLKKNYSRMDLAGTPTTVSWSGTSRMTTAPAPIITVSAMTEEGCIACIKLVFRVFTTDFLVSFLPIVTRVRHWL